MGYGLAGGGYGLTGGGYGGVEMRWGGGFGGRLTIF